MSNPGSTDAGLPRSGEVRRRDFDAQFPGDAGFAARYHDESRHYKYERLPQAYVKGEHDDTRGTNFVQAAGTSGDYSPGLCQSPTPWEGLCTRSNSEDSMDVHVKNQTPPETPPPASSPARSATRQVRHLNLSKQSSARPASPIDPIEPWNSCKTSPSGLKRAASSEFRPRLSPGAKETKPNPSANTKAHPPAIRPRPTGSGAAAFGCPAKSPKHPFAALPRDSGYASKGSTLYALQPGASRQYDSGFWPNETILPCANDHSSKPKLPSSLRKPTAEPPHELVQRPQPQQREQHSKKSQYPAMIQQPASSPISQDQLAAEIKGIYAGLVMVEAKCISIDATQAADLSVKLSSEQWEALIALHRTLLYEHHDFLMATQHPSANDALARLAVKYSMPARMWKHGIHAFLEVLRHRRPASQEYMLSFIYLAYSMMALLYETVPAFVDTWVECLGDLARYRMAIEEDRETHALWGGVAARWYTMAADRHPSIGRLCHHLGILERPSMHKFYFYAKALTSVVPFANTKESLATLCGPIVNDDKLAESRRQSAEACAITYHALLSFDRIAEAKDAAAQTIKMLGRLPAARWKDFGTSLAITNIASIFHLGAQNNLPRMVFVRDVQEMVKKDQDQTPYGSVPNLPPPPSFFETVLTTEPVPPNEMTIQFSIDSLALALKHYNDRDSLSGVLPFVHVNLVWLHSLSSLRSRHTSDSHILHMCDSLTGNVPWVSLSRFLNALTRFEKVTDRLEVCARQKVFLQKERKGCTTLLQDDFAIRGLVWSYGYFPQDWFKELEDDDGSRAIETPVMRQMRAERVVYLGLWLAFHTDFLQYDSKTRRFSAEGCEPDDIHVKVQQVHDDASRRSSSSATVSGASDVGGDFKHVKPSKSRRRQLPKKESYANVLSRKHSGMSDTCAIAGGVKIEGGANDCYQRFGF